MKIDKNNFFENTKADFTHVFSRPDREPDYISYKNSYYDYTDFLKSKNITEIEFSYDDFKALCNNYKEISSAYWYTDRGVYRQSDHWWQVSECDWSIGKSYDDDIIIGYCDWSDFNKKKYSTTSELFENKKDDFQTFNVFYHEKEGYRVVNNFGTEDEYTNDEFNFWLALYLKIYEKTYNIKVGENKINYIKEMYSNYIRK